MTATNASAWRAAGFCVAAFAIAACLVFLPTFLDIVRIWRGSPTYTHGFLILPISFALIWMRRHTLLQTAPYLSPIALIGVISALALHYLGTRLGFQIVQHFALVGLLIAGAVTLIGIRTAQLILFPLAFLFFAAPAGDELVPMLQGFTAWSIVTVLNLLQIPVYQDGAFLHTAAADFEVAEACAGLRFLVATVMVASLFAYLSFNSWRKKMIFMAAAVILPILANALRAIAIVLIATWSNQKYAVGFDHLVYGWGFFAVILMTLLFVGNRYSDTEILYPQPAEQIHPLPARHSRLWLLLVLLAMLAPGMFWSFA